MSTARPPLSSPATSAPVAHRESAQPAGLRRIVVGTDFSEPAKNAVRAAVDLAAVHGAELVLVNAVDPMITTLEVPVDALVDGVRQDLASECKRIERGGVKATTQMHIGKPWWVVNEVARDISADLVVVASHGRSGVARLALGSTADRVVRTCASPVLVLPATYAGSPSQWKTGVVGVDFSEESAIATSMAVRMLEKTTAARSTLVLFHTVALMIEFRGPDVPLALPEHWDQAESVALKQVESLAGSLRNSRLDVKAATFRGYPSDGILHEARTLNADFIALGTHGRGAVNRVLLGSVAERVLHHADRPVLTARHPHAAPAVQAEGGARFAG